VCVVIINNENIFVTGSHFLQIYSVSVVFSKPHETITLLFRRVRVNESRDDALCGRRCPEV
jgi:hypothetical protein